MESIPPDEVINTSPHASEGRGGANGIIPRNNLAIVPTNPLVDVNLIDSIVECRPQNFSAADAHITDDEILQLTIKQLRLLCSKCHFTCVTNRGDVSHKTVSTSGTQKDMVGKLLAYFQVYRQQRLLVLGATSPQNYCLSPTNFSCAEDARLVEILRDPHYREATDPIFKVVSRAILDAADGSPMIAAWGNVVAPLFNNIPAYHCPFRFPNEPPLNLCNPMSSSIPRRIPQHLRNRFATLRSRFTVVYKQWEESGGNDPDTFPNFVNLTSLLDVSIMYMFRVATEMEDSTFLKRTLRLIPTEAQVESEDIHDVLTRHNSAKKSRKESETGAEGGFSSDVSASKRLSIADIHNDLNELTSIMKGQNDAGILLDLQRNRDRAFQEKERLENLLLEDDNMTPRKRNRLNNIYKLRYKEWILLEKQVSEKTKIPFNEKAFRTSFNEEDSDEGSDDN